MYGGHLVQFYQVGMGSVSSAGPHENVRSRMCVGSSWWSRHSDARLAHATAAAGPGPARRLLQRAGAHRHVDDGAAGIVDADGLADAAGAARDRPRDQGTSVADLREGLGDAAGRSAASSPIPSA